MFSCRDESQGDASRRPDPAEKWRGCRTVLLFWLCSGIVTLVYSLFWLQIGMLAGVLGIVGSSLSLCGCCSRHRLPLNVHVSPEIWTPSLKSRILLFSFTHCGLLDFSNMSIWSHGSAVSIHSSQIFVCLPCRSQGYLLSPRQDSRPSPPCSSFSC